MVIQLQLGWTWIQHDPAALRKSVLEIFQFSSHSTSISVIFHLIPPVFPRNFSQFNPHPSPPQIPYRSSLITARIIWGPGYMVVCRAGAAGVGSNQPTAKDCWADAEKLMGYRVSLFFSKHKWRVCIFHMDYSNHVYNYTHYISSSWMIWWMSVVGWNCLHLMSTVMELEELDDGPKPTNDGLELSCGNDT